MTRAGAVLALFALLAGRAMPADTVIVGSKTFTESYVLAEIMAQTLERAGFTVERRFGLGNTMICYQALRSSEIDVYPEYSGTLREVILKQPARDADIETALQPLGLQVLAGFGFDNSYALATRAALANELGLERISDLAGHPSLRYAVSHEFQQRADGWPGLKALYRLTARETGIEHGLAYRAVSEGRIDVTDAYTTDGDIERYDLVVLTDDRDYFPDYRALPFARRGLPAAAKDALASLAGRIDADTMRRLNARVVVHGERFADVARVFLAGDAAAAAATRGTPWADLTRNTVTHLRLTGTALAAAIVIGILAGMAVFRSARWSQATLYVSGLLQTIPSIALLALLIPLLGIGEAPAIAALFLYSLLPIVRSTITALRTVDPVLRDVATGMGLTERERLRHVYLPLAVPNLLTGVRTAAVISIGTATLAAFIGAGGLGDPIVTGLALNDTALILQGAVPAALLALLTEFGFELLERRLVPAHLRHDVT